MFCTVGLWRFHTLDFQASQMTSESGWLNDDGELCLRAAGKPSSEWWGCSARIPGIYLGWAKKNRSHVASWNDLFHKCWSSLEFACGYFMSYPKDVSADIYGIHWYTKYRYVDIYLKETSESFLNPCAQSCSSRRAMMQQSSRCFGSNLTY